MLMNVLVKLINYLSWILTNTPSSIKTNIIHFRTIPKELISYLKMKRPNLKIIWFKNCHRIMPIMEQIFTNPFNLMKATISQISLTLISNLQITPTTNPTFQKRALNQPFNLNPIILSTNIKAKSSFITRWIEHKLT